MGVVKRKAAERDDVAIRLMNGHYDRELEDFQDQIDAATQALREAYAALRAENTLRS